MFVEKEGFSESTRTQDFFSGGFDPDGKQTNLSDHRHSNPEMEPQSRRVSFFWWDFSLYFIDYVVTTVTIFGDNLPEILVPIPK